MKVYLAYEKRYWGGPKPTWRPVGLTMRKGSAIAYALRRVRGKDL